MRTEKQRIIKQGLNMSFFLGPVSSTSIDVVHVYLKTTSLASVQVVEEHRALQHHQWSQKTALFQQCTYLKTQSHMNLPVWYFSAQQEAKLWISLLFSVKKWGKKGKWLRKQSPNIQGRNYIKLFLLLFREKDIEKKSYCLDKEREYNHIENFVLQELEVFKASRMTRLSKLKHAFKK